MSAAINLRGCGCSARPEGLGAVLPGVRYLDGLGGTLPTSQNSVLAIGGTLVVLYLLFGRGRR